MMAFISSGSVTQVVDCQEYDLSGGGCACTRTDCNGTSGTSIEYYITYTSADPYIENDIIYDDFDKYYEKSLIPKKLEFKSKAPGFIYKTFKQPISKTGFRRGQRNEA